MKKSQKNKNVSNFGGIKNLTGKDLIAYSTNKEERARRALQLALGSHLTKFSRQPYING